MGISPCCLLPWSQLLVCIYGGCQSKAIKVSSSTLSWHSPWQPPRHSWWHLSSWEWPQGHMALASWLVCLERKTSGDWDPSRLWWWLHSSRCTKGQSTVHFKWGDYMKRELYLNKAVLKKWDKKWANVMYSLPCMLWKPPAAVLVVCTLYLQTRHRLI